VRKIYLKRKKEKYKVGGIKPKLSQYHSTKRTPKKTN